MVPLIAQSGVGWIRDDFPWDTMEKEKGVYDIPPETMNWISAVSAAGIKIDLVFNYGNKIYADHYDPDAFAAAAAWTARTLAGKIQAMEILNEPANFGFSKFYDNGQQDWSGLQKDGSVAPYVSKYVNLINTAARAIRAANPDLKIIGLGMSPGANFHALAMGIASEVDGITDHPYSPRSAPEIVPYKATPGILKRDGIFTADEKGSFASQIKMYQARSARYNGPRQIWLTEQGWPTFLQTKPSQYAGFSEGAQARYLLRRLAESLGLGVTASFIYDLRDDGQNPSYNEHHYGLLDYQSNPKPSYIAVQHFTAAMANFRPRNNFKIDTSSGDSNPQALSAGGINGAPAREIKTYQFADGNGTPLVAVWNTAPADSNLGPLIADVKIQTAVPFSKITSYDPLDGSTKEVPFEVHGGTVTLKQFAIPDSPLLLTFARRSGM
jgi:hypothetical protein